ncbi:Uncharacterized protein M6B38_211565 [Iris pallida]|uniref:Uncharacterized protein n=1 Tax=Iris pallida TaxID=29817 RepID=A0AAX6E317_IRIPA|nr:Uncharacterized protein M6B38_211565 [Iris pallida]
MGGLCSKRSSVDKSPSDSTLNPNGLMDPEPVAAYDSSLKNHGEAKEKWVAQPPLSFSDRMMPTYGNAATEEEPWQLSSSLLMKSKSTRSKPPASSKTGTTKVSEVSSLLGRAGTVGLGKAVEVLDTLGSSMTSLHLSGGFVSGVGTKGNKICILAFEVANTVVKGANLMHSLSKENIKHLKEVVLPSEGVQHLISKDMNELLRMAAADKREELKIFSGEVVRFGNRCKDPQWHNLDRYFDKLESEVTRQSKLKEEAKAVMQQLMTMVQYTAELYHELHALDRFEQDYRRKLQEEDASTSVQRGENLQILRQELKGQRKHVKSLKKKSLWSKVLEEVMEKLVDVVHFLHLEIYGSFGSADGDKTVTRAINYQQRLGAAGLALHYANIITQIDTLVSRSSSVPPNTRDSLYQGLPPTIKSALRSRLQLFEVKEEITAPQIKAEMEKTLRWLVPIATNTTKAHHGFGWVGEWANTGTELNRKPPGHSDLIRIETLHYANKETTEACILDLVVWLHHLISLSRPAGTRSPTKSPIRSPTQKGLKVPLTGTKSSSPTTILTKEDQDMLRDISSRKLTPGISKSQEFDTVKYRLSNHSRLTKSSSHSPATWSKKELIPVRRLSMLPVIDFDIDRMKALDVIDNVDTVRKL